MVIRLYVYLCICFLVSGEDGRIKMTTQTIRQNGIFLGGGLIQFRLCFEIYMYT